MATKKDIENWFPNIIGKSFKITKSNFNFNCVAFTLDIFNDYMWVTEKIWPKQLPRKLNIESFKLLYELYGYKECFDDSYDKAFDKIAFYAKNNQPLHAAKQFGNIWKSKISNLIVEHELDWLSGNSYDSYGDIVFIMKRKK